MKPLYVALEERLPQLVRVGANLGCTLADEVARAYGATVTGLYITGQSVSVTVKPLSAPDLSQARVAAAVMKITDRGYRVRTHGATDFRDFHIYYPQATWIGRVTPEHFSFVFGGRVLKGQSPTCVSAVEDLFELKQPPESEYK